MKMQLQSRIKVQIETGLVLLRESILRAHIECVSVSNGSQALEPNRMDTNNVLVFIYFVSLLQCIATSMLVMFV